MSNIPYRIISGTHKGKIHCTQYCCLNNYGVQKGYIHESTYPTACCMLENPNYTIFDENLWGCSDERYGNEVGLPKESE